MTASTDPNARAAAVIAGLLSGNAPNGTSPAELGQWREVWVALVNAYEVGGTSAVRTTFEALARADAGLGRLVAGEPGRRRLTIHAASEVWAPREPRQWIVNGLLHAGDLALFVGAAGIGKTYLLLDLAVSVATGAEWLDRQTVGAPVLVIDEESGFHRLADRLEAVLRGHYLTPDVSVPLSFVSLAGFNFFSDATWFADLAAAIESTRSRLVIIDALADVMAGADENLVKDVSPIFRGLRGVADTTGAAILVIHHANRAGAYRGSSALPAAVDLALQADRNDAGVITIEAVKARDVESVKLSCRGDWSDTSFCLLPEALPSAVIRRKPEVYVLGALWRHPGGLTLKAIEAGADVCTSRSARNAVYDLASRKLVARSDDGGSGASATYALTDEGKQIARSLT